MIRSRRLYAAVLSSTVLWVLPWSAQAQTAQAPSMPAGQQAAPLSSPTAQTSASEPATDAVNDGAISQATPNAVSTDEQSGIADIVVTAQRRSESAQRTPIAITALSGDSLASAGVNQVTNLTARVPNISIGADSTGTTLLAIRGIGSTDVTETGDPTVALNLDGVYIARNTSMSGLFYDIDRVEVLRGPQGTLYGRSATAGAINIITKKPVFDFEGAASLEAGNYGTFATQGMVNVPLSDTVAARAAFSTRRHDGYANNGNGLHTKDQDDVAGRLQLLANLTDRLSIQLAGDYFHAGGVGGGFRRIERTYPFPSGSSAYDYPLTQPHRRDQTDWGTRAEINYDLGLGTLTYLFGYRETDGFLQGESPLSRQPFSQMAYQNQFSHELRLGGKTGRLTYVVGGNLFNEHNDFNLLLGVGAVPGATFRRFIKPEENAASKAVFTQLTYELVDGLRVTGGVRYTDDRKYSFNGQTYGETPAGIRTLLLLQNVDNRFNKTTWRAGLDYDLTPTSLLYGSVATGYKPGGYFDGDAPNTYAPENITAYEIGSKNRFFSNRLQANITGFYYDYRDFQVSATRQLFGALAGITQNAQKARVFGLELETVYKATPRDELSFTLGYLNAKYVLFYLPAGDGFTNFGQPAGAPVVPLQLDGATLARSPAFTFNIGYQRKFELANGGTVNASVYSHVETKQNLDYHNYAVTRKDAFSSTDLNLGYQAPGGKWYVTAYVRNVENRAVATIGALNSSTNNPASAGAALAPPRTFGAIVGTKF